MGVSTVGEPSTDLVPAENMSTLEQMDTATREVAVTRMLSEARSWLAHAMEATSPASIAEFKTWTLTIADATRRFNLSKELQTDSLEMVRRSERGLGVAIREGQKTGHMPKTGQHVTALLHKNRSSVESFFPEGNASQQAVMALADGVTDERFEEVLTESRAEENMSRANVGEPS